jgi:hypothetical protein
MRAILTPDDLRKGDPATPGWYPAEIVKYEEAVTKGTAEKPSDGSINAIFTIKVLDGDATVKGKEFKRYFNEKALGFGKNLWPILFPEFNKTKGGELTSEMFASSVGKKLKVYIKMDGQYSKVEDFQPLVV